MTLTPKEVEQAVADTRAYLEKNLRRPAEGASRLRQGLCLGMATSGNVENVQTVMQWADEGCRDAQAVLAEIALTFVVAGRPVPPPLVPLVHQRQRLGPSPHTQGGDAADDFDRNVFIWLAVESLKERGMTAKRASHIVSEALGQLPSDVVEARNVAAKRVSEIHRHWQKIFGAASRS